MKLLVKKKLVLLAIISLLALKSMAQLEKTFLYEIHLFEKYQHRSKWTDKEYEIQKQHVSYLDSLTKKGIIQLAGIVDEGLKDHKGIIILSTNSYQEAKKIALEDPSVKKGMMNVSIHPIHIYFKR